MTGDKCTENSEDKNNSAVATSSCTSKESSSTVPQQNSNAADENNEDEDWKIQRDAFKKNGDDAFRMKAYKTAIAEYSSAIALDPEYVILYSNRSAAYLANSEVSKALNDAQQCVTLDAGFIKGHSRLAAALLALRRYSQAFDSYQHVLSIEPENAAARQGKELCEKELKRIQEAQQEDHDVTVQPSSHLPQKDSADDKTDENKNNNNDGDDGDDLLDDFFKDVEEVVAKKKEVKAAAVAEAEATNAIRNDREVLGTTEEQMDRLLQEHFEWRNLNPYFVLQLPTTATDDDISRRYKALSLLLHPDKNHAKLSEKDRERAQLAYDQVQKAKQLLSDDDKKRHVIGLVQEGMKNGEHKWVQEQRKRSKETLESCQEKEVMRIFAQVEQKRREVEERERKYEQRQQEQEDEQLEKERKERKFDKQWKEEGRVDKRVGNWRDFSHKKKRKV
ncbi:serine/threonine protein kinase [Nitzschia inconspicua]|uniref:Serine/threonine protein kinase n=1 Tax=Nitzschia inconspicua TaxID=303405 RepID=A0A9K3LCW9_9STRA|nr:serine/threonine protein kinase [Nitzschia inconspicua]